jgi:hypothetical protein
VPEFVVYDFRMDAWQPQTLPMKRLGEYVAELAKLFGSLRDDACSATLKLKGGARVLAFPGIKTVLSEEVVVQEAGVLDGVIIRVGGRDDSVPVWLEGEAREKLQCTASRTIAKELAAHLFGEPVRVNGSGRWRRGADRMWTMESFTIKSRELLESSTLFRRCRHRQSGRSCVHSRSSDRPAADAHE